MKKVICQEDFLRKVISSRAVSRNTIAVRNREIEQSRISKGVRIKLMAPRRLQQTKEQQVMAEEGSLQKGRMNAIMRLRVKLRRERPLKKDSPRVMGIIAARSRKTSIQITIRKVTVVHLEEVLDPDRITMEQVNIG